MNTLDVMHFKALRCSIQKSNEADKKLEKFYTAVVMFDMENAEKAAPVKPVFSANLVKQAGGRRKFVAQLMARIHFLNDFLKERDGC
jgi:hypothetical protein